MLLNRMTEHDGAKGYGAKGLDRMTEQEVYGARGFSV